MRIDWKRVGADGLDFTFPPLNWSDPTHIPLMVAEATWEIGNLSEFCFFDHEGEPLPILHELHLIALDHIPLGEQAIRKALQERIRETAIIEGWEDCLFMPGTTEYPYETE